MSEPAPPSAVPVDAAAIAQAHQLYCQLTGQRLRLAFDRERMWYELLRLGYSLQDLRTVITYLQREIRAARRNVGALKLSNPTASRKTSRSVACAYGRPRPLHPLRHRRPPCRPVSNNKVASGP